MYFRIVCFNHMFSPSVFSHAKRPRRLRAPTRDREDDLTTRSCIYALRAVLGLRAVYLPHLPSIHMFFSAVFSQAKRPRRSRVPARDRWDDPSFHASLKMTASEKQFEAERKAKAVVKVPSFTDQITGEKVSVQQLYF